MGLSENIGQPSFPMGPVIPSQEVHLGYDDYGVSCTFSESSHGSIGIIIGYLLILSYLQNTTRIMG